MVLLGAVRVDFDAVLMCFLSLSFYSFCIASRKRVIFELHRKVAKINTFFVYTSLPEENSFILSFKYFELCAYRIKPLANCNYFLLLCSDKVRHSQI